MKFPYKKYTSEVLRPIIPIEVIGKQTILTYEVLVDSGADVNIFSSELANRLGIDLTKGNKGTVAGITGESKPFYFHNIDIKVGGNLFKNVRVGFLKDMGEYGYGIVGQKGFFDLFIVKFDIIKEEIELRERSYH